MILAFLVFWPFVGGLLAYCVGNGFIKGLSEKNCELCRDYLADFVTASEFAAAVVLLFLGRKLGFGESLTAMRIPEICGLGLSFTLDGFRLIYGAMASLMWMMTAILSREYFTHHRNRNRFYLFFLLTEGATMGVFLSADLFTTFIFFEIMSLTSYVWVAQEEDRGALRAAGIYLAVALTGGLVMLMGLFLLYNKLGTLTISELLPKARACGDKNVLYASGACLLVGFGAKAGAFPLHIWLPKAHPVAPAPASALLSGILTKTGVFGILVVSCDLFLYDGQWGDLILWIGVLTMVGGALLGVFSVDLKRTLACSSMSQIGFILVGIGMQGLLGEENALAVHGTLIHMVNHSLIKLVLFMAAGVIFMNTHELNLNEIRGFGKKKPLLKAIFLVGALAIAGVPFFGGYISKTLLHESILEYGSGTMIRTVEYLFLFSGGLTVAYMTKLYTAIFVETNENPETQRRFDKMKNYMKPDSTFALAGSALILLIWGLFPHGIMDRAARLGQGFMQLETAGETVEYFSVKNLSGALVSIAIGCAVYALIRKYLMRKDKKGVRQYINCWPQWMDLENMIYRPLFLGFLPVVGAIASRVLDSALDTVTVVLRKTLYKDSPLPHELSEGTGFTVAAGKLLNLWQSLGNRLWKRNNPGKRDYVHLLAMKHEEVKENNMIIQRSLSFGLLLVCIGICLTLIYLIFW